MAFEELYTGDHVVVLVGLRGSDWDRRARRRRASELRRLHDAIAEAQWQISLRASLAKSRRLLQGWQVDRALWTKRRSTHVCQGIVPVAFGSLRWTKCR